LLTRDKRKKKVEKAKKYEEKTSLNRVFFSLTIEGVRFINKKRNSVHQAI